jgi:hypothetical protein
MTLERQYDNDREEPLRYWKSEQVNSNRLGAVYVFGILVQPSEAETSVVKEHQRFILA